MNGKVTIRVAVREGITRLAESYYTPPYKVANITEDKKAPELHLMLMCSSPGLLDGDKMAIRLELGGGSRLQWHTQAYQRLFRMEKGASQRMEVLVGACASFCYLPHPCVPHAKAVFTGTNKIELSEGSRLVWGEVLTCGRKLSGEVFSFSKYHTITEVFCSGRLVLRENINLQPAVMDLQAMGQLEGYTHQASLLYMGGGGDGEGAEAARQPAIQAYLSAQVGVLGAVSAGPGGSLVVRILGNHAEQLYDCLKTVAGFLSFTKPLNYAG